MKNMTSIDETGEVKTMRTIIPCTLISFALCLLLVVIPAAADGDSFALAYEDTLTVYGNANSDDIIDENDIEYVRGIIDGTRDKTQFADANYDGQIDEDDISQIELIIAGGEENLTILDMDNRTVTVPMPVERIVPAAGFDATRALVQLGAKDKIVGCCYPTSWSPIWYAAPELADLPDIGGSEGKSFNVELAVSLEPDVIFVSTSSKADELQEKSKVPIIAVTGTADGLWAVDMLRIVGAITRTDTRARDLITYANEKVDEMTEITSKIPDEDKLLVYYCACGSYEGVPFICRACGRYSSIDLAGGLSLIEATGNSQVSKEQIIKWNPDVIFMAHGNSEMVNEVLSDPVLQNVNAVKNERVYSTKGGYYGRGALGQRLSQAYYFAKLTYPKEFEDLDMEKVGNEIMEYFYGVDGIYTDMIEEYDLYRGD
jgi:iron complex transport system substrate-binding protein